MYVVIIGGDGSAVVSGKTLVQYSPASTPTLSTWMCAGLRHPTAWLDLTALGRKDTSRTSPVTGDTRNIIANTANNARNVKTWPDGKKGGNPWTGGQSACSRHAMAAAGQSGRQEAALGRGR